MKLSNSIYDVLKLITVIILPVADFIAAFCTIWGLPYGPQICATLTALHAMLGALVTASNVQYKKDND